MFMKIVVAIDSFKGSLTSIEAGNAALCGIKRVLPDAEVSVLPIADGGEGTVEALAGSMGGRLERVSVQGPLQKRVSAKYGIVGNTAIIEMAEASGIFLVSRDELDPMRATTFGVGEVILDAISKGCRDFIIGIGGSATNDGGTGMLSALGFEFLKSDGKPISFGARELSEISEIKDDKVLPEAFECTFNIACDVTNPLCGEHGCSAVFSPQKGARAEDIPVMDAGLKNYAEKTKLKYKDADMEFPGAGAAGGLGFAFMSYLRGRLQSGISLILRKIKLEEYIKEADLVITGEGRLDSQTVMGKAPSGVVELAKKYNKPTVAFSGCVTRDARVCNDHGIDAFFPVVRGACTLDEAMDKENARRNMEDTVEQVMRLYTIKER